MTNCNNNLQTPGCRLWEPILVDSSPGEKFRESFKAVLNHERLKGAVIYIVEFYIDLNFSEWGWQSISRKRKGHTFQRVKDLGSTRANLWGLSSLIFDRRAATDWVLLISTENIFSRSSLMRTSTFWLSASATVMIVHVEKRRVESTLISTYVLLPKESHQCQCHCQWSGRKW